MRAIIVGAGIVGAACGYELAAHGVDVLIIDQGDPPAGASGRSARTRFAGAGHMATRRSGARRG